MEEATHETAFIADQEKKTEEWIEVCEDVRVDEGRLQYGVEDVPPWYMCLLLGFQHCLTMFGSTLAIPLILSKFLCLQTNYLATGRIVSTSFFVSGISTLLQTTIGNRLPIVQGGSFAYLPPVIAILTVERGYCANLQTLTQNGTNMTTDDSWMPAMCEVQGAIIVASFFQILIGFTGMIGFLLRYIGPLAITPTISLVGLALFQTVAIDYAGKHWGIAALTAFLIIVFSQYMRNIQIPTCKKGYRLPIFLMFPIILSIVVSWCLCWVLTAAGALSDDPDQADYNIRTDVHVSVLHASPWITFPYPGQWGWPTVSLAGVFGVLSGVLASMLESLGDYYACAALSGAPAPPTHALNRGIGVEGLSCIVAGLWGTGSGSTSYSENIGAIGITKVGSRRVVQTSACILIVFGLFSKLGTFFVTIPTPLIGGVFIVMFGMITAVGLANLRFVDLTSTRNLFILGFSIFCGLVVPHWVRANPRFVQSGSPSLDQIVEVLLRTSMFVGGMVGFILDNTIPGTPEERGLTAWCSKLGTSDSSLACYDLPFCGDFFRRYKIFRFCPFLPAYKEDMSCRCFKRKTVKITE